MNDSHDFLSENAAYQEAVARKRNEIRMHLRNAKTVKPECHDSAQARGSDSAAQQKRREEDIVGAWNRESRYAYIGSLLFRSGDLIPLKPGRNSIGRGADADISIGKTNIRLSRLHLIIQAQGKPGEGYVHEAQISKPEVNETRINNVRMAFGKTYRLKHGDVISIPSGGVEFKFVSYNRN